MYESIQTFRSGFEVYWDLQIEGGHGERRCLADTYLSEGVFFSDADDFSKDLTVEWPGNSMSSPIRDI